MSAAPNISADVAVASYLVNNPDMYGSFLCRMSVPFGEKVTGSIFRILERIWKKHESFPNESELIELLSRHRQLEKKEELLDIYVKRVKQIYNPLNHRNSTRDVILGRITDNYKIHLQELMEGISPDNIVDKTLEVHQQIDKLNDLLSGKKKELWIMPLSDEALENPVALLEELLGEPITTGIAPWDRWLWGGPRRGESMMIVGLTNDGKSGVCESITNDQIRTGLRVIKYILDSAESDVYTKPWANFSGVGIEDDKVSNDFEARLRRNVRPEMRGLMLCRHWGRDQHTVDDIRRDLDEAAKFCRQWDLRNGVPADKAGHIDTVLIDSPDCLAAKKGTTENWKAQSSVYSACDGICKERGVFGLFPSQAKIGGTQMDVIDMKQVAESWGKNHPMTFVVGVCRTSQERKHNEMRLYVDKAKRIKCHYMVPLHFNKNLMRLTAKGEPYYSHNDAEQSANEEKRVARQEKRRLTLNREKDPMAKLPLSRDLKRKWFIRPRDEEDDGDDEGFVRRRKRE